ncbi:5944_t:CDS:2 [Cetraspora pellucida]|uniref:5944_t:CDS:1 n=1 Tax=Cetraspora pellucida TaxID=1433469 RepID=A0ACA9K9N8_9GLOM|nr:5944_t:CDS:2 [Cetraspora pellucida]
MSTSLLHTDSPSTSTSSFTKYNKLTGINPVRFSWIRQLDCFKDEKYYAKEFFIKDKEIHKVHRQKSTWSFLGLLFSFVIMFTSVKISLTDTSDKRVMRENKERDMTYARMKGIPVVVDDLMDMTTVEYLSHQQHRRYYSDNYEDEDDENPWRRPYYHNPWKRWIMGIIRKVCKEK